MKQELLFFWIPVVDHTEAAAALNQCLAKHQVLGLEKRLVETAEPGWAVCVTVALTGAEKSAKKTKIDYREVLDEESFRIFSGLRTLRKELAARDGVALYNVADNAQLAEIANDRITTVQGLAAVAGFGAARRGKYGAALVASCADLIGTEAGPAAP